jgi:hypothetical protein
LASASATTALSDRRSSLTSPDSVSVMVRRPSRPALALSARGAAAIRGPAQMVVRFLLEGVAERKQRVSLHQGPTSWRPSGSPSVVNPQGTDRAGTSAKDQTKVKRVRSFVARIIALLASARGAGPATVGVRMASTFSNMSGHERVPALLGPHGPRIVDARSRDSRSSSARGCPAPRPDCASSSARAVEVGRVGQQHRRHDLLDRRRIRQVDGRTSSAPIDRKTVPAPPRSACRDRHECRRWKKLLRHADAKAARTPRPTAARKLSTGWAREIGSAGSWPAMAS